jgi:hypothetical protein
MGPQSDTDAENSMNFENISVAHWLDESQPSLLQSPREIADLSDLFGWDPHDAPL